MPWPWIFAISSRHQLIRRDAYALKPERNLESFKTHDARNQGDWLKLRGPLLATIDQMSRDFERQINNVATNDQRQASGWLALGRVREQPLSADKVDKIVPYFDLAIGICLFLGLFTRTAAVLSTGVLAGLGGAYMAEVGAGLFVPYMTGGAGFIGIVLAMLARGRPVWVLYGALLFGVSLALTTALQVGGFNIPTDVVQMLPFFMVMVVLVAFARHSVLPPALGLPYVRGER